MSVSRAIPVRSSDDYPTDSPCEDERLLREAVQVGRVPITPSIYRPPHPKPVTRAGAAPQAGAR
jgi:hypothetical protein